MFKKKYSLGDLDTFPPFHLQFVEDFSFSFPQHRFFNSSTVAILGQIILCYGSCPINRTFSSIFGLYSLDTSSTPQVVMTKMSSDIPVGPQRGNHPHENHGFRDFSRPVKSPGIKSGIQLRGKNLLVTLFFSGMAAFSSLD